MGSFKVIAKTGIEIVAELGPYHDFDEARGDAQELADKMVDAAQVYVLDEMAQAELGVGGPVPFSQAPELQLEETALALVPEANPQESLYLLSRGGPGTSGTIERLLREYGFTHRRTASYPAYRNEEPVDHHNFGHPLLSSDYRFVYHQQPISGKFVWQAQTGSSGRASGSRFTEGSNSDRIKLRDYLKRKTRKLNPERGPSASGANWNRLSWGWLYDNENDGVAFKVTEKLGPGIPLYTLTALTDQGVFKHKEPYQWKHPEDAFLAAKEWFPAMAGHTAFSDLTSNWLKLNPEQWLQEADEEIEEAGTEGAFTKQARRAGYKNTMQFARAVMKGWRSGKKTVLNKKTRKQQGITKKTMSRANFAINAQKRNPDRDVPSALTRAERAELRSIWGAEPDISQAQRQRMAELVSKADPVVARHPHPEKAAWPSERARWRNPSGPLLWSRNDWTIEWYDPQKKWRGFLVEGPNHSDHPSVYSLGKRGAETYAEVGFDRPESIPKYVQAAVSRMAHRYADDLDLKRPNAQNRNPERYLSADQERLLDEVVLTAENYGHHYPSDPAKAVDEAIRTIKDYREVGLDEDMTEIRSFAIRRVQGGWSRRNPAGRHPMDGPRRHQLLPVTVAKTIPPLYSQEDVADPIARVKFFSPFSSFTGFATEFDGDDTLFGWWDFGMGGGELGYQSLSEIQSANRNGLPLVERDMYWKAQPLSKAKQEGR